MYESQSIDYRQEIERLATELQDTKKAWFKVKKQEQRRKEKEVAEATTPSIPTQGQNRSRFTGGGFNLNQNAMKV